MGKGKPGRVSAGEPAKRIRRRRGNGRLRGFVGAGRLTIRAAVATHWALGLQWVKAKPVSVGAAKPARRDVTMPSRVIRTLGAWTHARPASSLLLPSIRHASRVQPPRLRWALADVLCQDVSVGPSEHGYRVHRANEAKSRSDSKRFLAQVPGVRPGHGGESAVNARWRLASPTCSGRAVNNT